MSHFDVYAVCRNCFSPIRRLRLPVGTPVSTVTCPVCGVDALKAGALAHREAEPTELAVDD